MNMLDNVFEKLNANLKKNTVKDKEYRDKLSKFKKRLREIKKEEAKKQIIILDPVGLNKISIVKDVPRTQSKLSKKLECPPGKEINPKTGRCIKIKPKVVPRKKKEKNILQKIKNLEIK